MRAPALLALALLTPPALFYYEHQHRPEDVAKRDPELGPEPALSPERQARELRRSAIEQCWKGETERCLEGLDRARALDLGGDAAPEIVSAHRAAAARLAPTPSALPIPSALTVPSATPPRRLAPRLSKPTMDGRSSSLTPAPTSAPPVSIDSSGFSDFGAPQAHKVERQGK